MYRKAKQQNYELQTQHSEITKVPILKPKTFSFTDPLFQSFGNGYRQGNDNYQPEFNHRQAARIQINSASEVSQNLEQLFQISERISLLKNMLKISNLISDPFVLLVNTQNKTKTQMLIESKKQNYDGDSKVFCENAQKYLSFLDVVSHEQNNNKTDIFTDGQFQKDVKFNLESRIQCVSHVQEQLNQKKQFQNVPEVIFNVAKPISTASKLSNDYHQNIIPSFMSIENSKYLSQNPQSTHFTCNFQTAEKMFQQIQTPKIPKNSQQRFFKPKPHFTPQNHEKPGLKLHDKEPTINQKSPSSSAVFQGKYKKLFSRQNIHNKKQKIQIGKIQVKQVLANKDNKKPLTSKSRSKDLNSRQNNLKQKADPKRNIKSNQKQIFNEKNIDSEQYKSLAFKAVDKTSQFQKMLKMASSRFHQS